MKIILNAFIVPLLLLFESPEARPPNASRAAKETPTKHGERGTLQKMIVAGGSVTMDIDVNRINGANSTAGKLEALHFAVTANSFFPVLVFNNVLRGPGPGSMGLVPQNNVALPAALTASVNRLAIEKIGWSEPFDMVVRDAMSGFVFFNIEGNLYDYDATAQLLGIHGGRLLISKEFGTALGRRADAGLVVGKISAQTAMQPIEITQLVNGAPKSVVMPPLRGVVSRETPTLVPGPDVIVGELPSLDQFGSAGTQVGLAVGTTSCNNGDQPVGWFELPNNDHPVIPQNLYRMSGGVSNSERFEQIGQSWVKHTFDAEEDTDCGTCNTNGCEPGTHLCPGCSDPYASPINANQDQLGSRAWVNPFTGSFSYEANDHNFHNHDGVSHRIRVEVNDLNTTLNQGATYFAEAAYISPDEYTWCQAHPGQCNMYNNVSYRQFLVTGITNFTFSPVLPTVRMQPAIIAWAGATINQYQPDSGNDGIWFMGYKVSNPSPGVWHYEYALYNENLDRSIQSFSVPLAIGANISNIGFHAPPQEPGWANDGTFNNQGYSSMPWQITQASDSIIWNCETIAQNQNANAIRFGTLYNFRFDTDRPPQNANATVGFFKTGSPMTVGIQAPGPVVTPTPTPTASPTPTPTPTCAPVTKIYDIGGYDAVNVTSTNRIYDIPTNTWTTGAHLPAGLSDHATAYANGKIYVAGGWAGSTAVNTLYIYDIASDTWTTGAPMPQALHLPGFGIIDGKLYIASGNSGGGEVNTLYIYDIATNSWTSGPNVPTPVTGPGSAVYQGKLYLFGGFSFPMTITATQIFDPVTNSWSSGPNMNVGRLWFYGAAADNTGVVAPGGDTAQGHPTNDNEQLTGSWAVRAPLPYNARGPFIVSDGTYFYIGGGYDNSTVHADLLRYDPVANTYTSLMPSPDGHFLSQAVLVSVVCSTPTPTPTATPTPTPTPTPRPSPTPRTFPTPRTRPTPPPRP